MDHRQGIPLLLIIIFVLFPSVSDGQEKGMEYHTLLKANPGVTGIEGNASLRFSYMNYYPGNNFNLHSVSISYDGYFEPVHGGAGLYLSSDYLGGIVNDLAGGFSYSYFFRAGNDIYISAGLSPSLLRRGYSPGNMVLPDQIDPLLGSVLTSAQMLDSRSRTVFDLAAGAVIFYKDQFAGVSVSHLTSPDLSAGGQVENKLKRSLLVHFTGNADISGNGEIRMRPVLRVESAADYKSAGAGSFFETPHISAGAMLFYNNRKQSDIQTGIEIIVKDLRLFYSYRFNIFGGDNLLPVSVLHNTGLALSLKNVDKRKTVKTINFPEM